MEDVTQLVRLGRNLLDLHTQFDLDYYRLEESFDELFGSNYSPFFESSF